MAEVTADSELKMFQDKTRQMPGLYASTCPRTRTIVSCNESLAKTLEFGSIQDLIGRSINDIYDWDCHNLFDHYYKLWLRSGEFEGLGLSLKTQSGKKLPIYVQVQSIRDESQNIRYSKVNYRPLNWLTPSPNLTNQKPEESLSDTINIPWVQTFHHELNQVLGLCSIQTEILKSKLNSDPFDLESARQMAQKIHKTSLLLKPLIQAQHPLTQELAIHGTCDPLIQLSQTLSLFEPRFIHSQISLVSDISRERTTLKLTTSTFLQIIFNLLTNAIEACKDQKSKKMISVSTQVDAQSLEIEIANTGEVVPQSIQRHLFSPYFSTKRSMAHKGLGLYICRKIMQKVGGTIDYFERDGQAVFRLKFPIEYTKK